MPFGSGKNTNEPKISPFEPTIEEDVGIEREIERENLGV